MFSFKGHVRCLTFWFVKEEETKPMSETESLKRIKSWGWFQESFNWKFVNFYIETFNYFPEMLQVFLTFKSRIYCFKLNGRSDNVTFKYSDYVRCGRHRHVAIRENVMSS